MSSKDVSKSSKDENYSSRLQEHDELAAEFDSATLGESSSNLTSRAVPRKATTAELEANFARRAAEARARLEAKAKAKADAEASALAQQQAEAQLRTQAFAESIKRPRESSLSASNKRGKPSDDNNMDIDEEQPSQVVEPDMRQRMRDFDLRACKYKPGMCHSCFLSINNKPLIGGVEMSNAPYHISCYIDEGGLGLCRIRIVFRSNRVEYLDESIHSDPNKTEQFCSTFYPGVDYDGNEIIAGFAHLRMTDADFLWQSLDTQVLSRCQKYDQETMIALLIMADTRILTGALDLNIWCGKLGTEVSQNIEALLGGSYMINLWLKDETTTESSTTQALENFNFTWQAQLPPFHRFKHQPEDEEQQPLID